MYGIVRNRFLSVCSTKFVCFQDDEALAVKLAVADKYVK